MTTQTTKTNPSNTRDVVLRGRPGARRPRRTRLAAPAVLAFVALALGGCGDGEPEASGQETAATSTGTESPTATAADVELSELIGDAAAYDDDLVRVRGVADNHGPGIFSLVPNDATAAGTEATPTSTEDPSDGVDGLIVVHALGEGPDDGDVVTVTGQVNDSFDVAAVEDVLGIDIDDELVRTLNLGSDDAVLVADDVQTA